MIGDQEQLTARQTATLAIKLRIKSGYVRLQQALNSILLEHVFRNYSNSIQFIKKHIYKGRLKHLEEREAQLLVLIEATQIFKDPKKPKAWIEVNNGEEKHGEGSHSWKNEAEADMCANIATKIIEGKRVTAENIVVITMYLG